MNWKPSEGLKRTHAIVGELEAAAVACGVGSGMAGDWGFPPIYQHRMVEVIAKAIDAALSDGAAQDVIASMVGNGHAHQEGWTVLQGQGGGLGGYKGPVLAEGAGVPATADPVGLDMPDFPAPSRVYETDQFVDSTTENLPTAADAVEVASPVTKKRGRPKGFKGQKKAKAAKAKAVAAPDEGVPEARPDDAA